MNGTPQISIITCFYNAEKFIYSYFSELDKQTYRNFELVLVNDGSCDKSNEIVCQEIKNRPYVKYIVQENKGLGPARNVGLDHAKGDYIYFLDIDDRIVPNALERMLCLIEKNGVDIVTFNSINRDDKFENEKNSPYKFRRIGNGKYEALDFLDKALGKKSFYVPVWLFFYRRDFLEKENVKYLPIIHEDCVYTIHNVIKAEEIFYANEILHERRIVDNSIMHKKISERRIAGAIKVMHEANDLYCSQENLRIRKILRRWNYLCTVLAVSAVEDSEYCKKYRGQLFCYLWERKYMLNFKGFVRLILLFVRG